VNKEEALEIFDGIMLGDGGIHHPLYPSFALALSGTKLKIPTKDLMSYLGYVKEALESLGVVICSGNPRVTRRKFSHSGKPYDYCYLETRTALFIAAQFRRWYPDKHRKQVPEDLELTPLALAKWFEGDGTSSKSAPGRPLFDCVNLCTQSFNSYSVNLLGAQLSRLNVHTTVQYNKSKPKIYILQDSVDDFMRIIDPYVIEPYRYKIKYRR